MSKAAAFVLIGLFAASLGPACRVAPVRPDKVVLLGFDGAAPDLLQVLLEQGRLPNLAALVRRGSYGPSRTFPPVKSAILWTSIATGKTMLKHGIVDWAYVDRSGLQVPYESTQRRAATYWEILDAAGVSTGTLGWWLTSPPPALRNGFLLSDGYRLEPSARMVHPPDLHEALGPLVPRPHDVRREWQRFGLLDYRAEAAQQPLSPMGRSILGAYRGYLLSDLMIDRFSDELRRRRPVRVFSTYFRVVDVTGHFGLNFASPEVYRASLARQEKGVLPPDAEAAMTRAMAEAMLPAYRLMDHIVGKYVAALDPSSLLVICSDHGFGWYDGTYTHYHRAQEPPSGVILLAGPGVRAGHRLQGATVLDIAPTILHALGLPVGQDMDGRALERAFEPAWRERFPLRTIATHETGARPTPAAPRDRAIDEKRLEDLRTLGYIDAGGEPR